MSASVCRTEAEMAAVMRAPQPGPHPDRLHRRVLDWIRFPVALTHRLVALSLRERNATTGCSRTAVVLDDTVGRHGWDGNTSRPMVELLSGKGIGDKVVGHTVIAQVDADEARGR